MIEDKLINNPNWVLTETQDKQQEFVVVLSLCDEQQQYFESVNQCFIAHGIAVEFTPLMMCTHAELTFGSTTQQAWSLFKRLFAIANKNNVDVAVLPITSRKKELLLCDMDSTIVSSETLDDIASVAGIGEQVSQITERAMRGELNFRQALDRRVSLLKGLPETILTDIIEMVSYNKGAEHLMNISRQQGLRTVLVSGGFEPIVKHVANKLGFDRYVCNRVQLEEGKLNGKVHPPIVDSETKLNVLKQECEQLNIKLEQACCIGDGANDLPMLSNAGLGIGFYAKPIVRNTIPYQINANGLEFTLSIMGIAE